MITRRIIPAAFVLIATFSGVAQAADMAVRPTYKAPAFVPVAPYNWSGFYVGGNLGYGWAKASADVTGPAGLAASASENLNGGILGLQAGYNWQIGQWVVGLETDIQGTSQKASQTATCPAATCGVLVTATRDSKLPWFGTTRLRLGYALDRWMVYATGGLAYGAHKTDVNVVAGASTGSGSNTETKAGLAVGAGVEMGLSRNWSAKLEYLYLDTGTITTTTTVAGYGTVTENERVKNNLVRMGLNYHF